MTPEELREIMHVLGENQTSLGGKIGYNNRTICYWAMGRTAIPKCVEAYLNLRLLNIDMRNRINACFDGESVVPVLLEGVDDVR